MNPASGNRSLFIVIKAAQLLATRRWPLGSQMQGITGPFQMNLGGLGLRRLKGCSPLGGNGLYPIVAGTAHGGPVQREQFRQKFALYAWDGTATNNVARPQKLIEGLLPYTGQPEGVDLMQVRGEWRVLFVEDRYQPTGYATRNAVHRPVSILGVVN